MDVGRLVFLQLDRIRQGLNCLIKELQIRERDPQMVMQVWHISLKGLVLEGLIEVSHTFLELLVLVVGQSSPVVDLRVVGLLLQRI